MNLKENINSLLKSVGLKAEEIRLEEMKLIDGVTTIEAEVFEVGYPVFIIAEGASIALPVGEYELEDGNILTVVDEGIIGNIAPKEEEVVEEEEPVNAPPSAPNAPEMAMEEAPATPEREPKRVIESIVKELQFESDKAKDEEIETLKAQIAELKSQLEPKEEVELSSDEPAATPITHNPESGVEVEVFKYAKNRSMSSMDRVLNKLNK